MSVNSPYIILLSISVFVNVVLFTFYNSFVSFPLGTVNLLGSSKIVEDRRLIENTKITALPGESKKLETMRVIGGRTHTDKIYQHR